MVVVRMDSNACFSAAEGVARELLAAGLLAAPWHRHRRGDGKPLAVLATARPVVAGEEGGTTQADALRAADVAAVVGKALARSRLIARADVMALSEFARSHCVAGLSPLEDALVPLVTWVAAARLQAAMAGTYWLLDLLCITESDGGWMGVEIRVRGVEEHGSGARILCEAIPRSPRLPRWRIERDEEAMVTQAWAAAAGEERAFDAYVRRLEHSGLLSSMQCEVGTAALLGKMHVVVLGLPTAWRRDLLRRSVARGVATKEATAEDDVAAQWGLICGIPPTDLQGRQVVVLRVEKGVVEEADAVPAQLLTRGVLGDTRKRWEPAAANLADRMVGVLSTSLASVGLGVDREQAGGGDGASSTPLDLGQGPVLGRASALPGAQPPEAAPRQRQAGLLMPAPSRLRERVYAPPPPCRKRAGHPASEPAPAVSKKRRSGTTGTAGRPGGNSKVRVPAPPAGAPRKATEKAASKVQPRSVADARTSDKRAVGISPAASQAAPAAVPRSDAAGTQSGSLVEDYRKELAKLRVPNLKSLCGTLGIKKSGKKSDIVERLAVAMAAQAAGSA